MESSYAKEFNHASSLPIQDFHAMPGSAAGRLCLVDAASPPRRQGTGLGWPQSVYGLSWGEARGFSQDHPKGPTAAVRNQVSRQPSQAGIKAGRRVATNTARV